MFNTWNSFSQCKWSGSTVGFKFNVFTEEYSFIPDTSGE